MTMSFSSRAVIKKTWIKTFFACTFCFPNADHVLILKRFGPFFCSLKGVHAGIFMLACALFNEV